MIHYNVTSCPTSGQETSSQFSIHDMETWQVHIAVPFIRYTPLAWVVWPIRWYCHWNTI